MVRSKVKKLYIKYLGIFIDSNLSWKPQIEHISKKCIYVYIYLFYISLFLCLFVCLFIYLIIIYVRIVNNGTSLAERMLRWAFC